MFNTEAPSLRALLKTQENPFVQLDSEVQIRYRLILMFYIPTYTVLIYLLFITLFTQWGFLLSFFFFVFLFLYIAY